MKTFWRVLCLSILALPALAVATERQGCDLVNFSAEVLAKFPNARDACIDVREKNGGIYVHYQAEVMAVSSDTVTINILNQKGKAISKATFVPAADQMADVDGKDVKFTDLKKGMKLDFYVEHSKWGLYAKPDGKRLTILSQETLQ